MARIRKHYGKWQVLYRDPATKRERSIGVFTRKGDATRMKRQLEYQLETGEWIDPALKQTRLDAWAAQWLATRSHLKPKTIETYESLLNARVLPAFGEARLQDIRGIDVDTWVAQMSAYGLSASRIRQAYHVLNSILDSAVRNRMISSNPAHGVALPKKPVREMLFLTPTEVDDLAAAVDDRYETLVYTLAYCGLRAGEATALRRNRVNLLRAELVVAESATEVHGHLVFGETKNRRMRTVGVPPFLRHKLEGHMETYSTPDPSSLVFTSPDGGPLRLSNFRQREWKPAVRNAGLDPKLRVHDLRHTAVAMLISQGTYPKDVQEHLGHSSFAVTMDLYGHLYPMARERVAETLEDVYRKRSGSP